MYVALEVTYKQLLKSSSVDSLESGQNLHVKLLLPESRPGAGFMVVADFTNLISRHVPTSCCRLGLIYNRIADLQQIRRFTTDSQIYDNHESRPRLGILFDFGNFRLIYSHIFLRGTCKGMLACQERRRRGTGNPLRVNRYHFS